MRLRTSERPVESRSTDQSGFTLLELIIALALLATVLTVSYNILSNILDVEREITRKSTPEKIGQGILSLVRRDVLAVVYRNLGERVFQVVDNGEGPTAQDEIQFLNTSQTLTPDELAGQIEGDGLQAVMSPYDAPNSITAVHWFLQPNAEGREAGVFVLYRRENPEFSGVDPFGSGGFSYEIYDKVRAFSIEVFDGYEWLTAWDSQSRLVLEAEEAAEEQAVDTGGDQVTASAGPIRGVATDEEEVDPMLALEEQLKPPAAVPVAVRVEITFLAGDEKGAYTASDGRRVRDDFQEFTYSTVIPIITALRIPLSSEEEILAEQEALMGGDELGPGGSPASGDAAGRSPGSFSEAKDAVERASGVRLPSR